MKENLNLSSIISAILFGIANWSMEGWIYDLMGDMDQAGKDHAPQYNASEHIQILYSVFFFRRRHHFVEFLRQLDAGQLSEDQRRAFRRKTSHGTPKEMARH